MAYRLGIAAAILLFTVTCSLFAQGQSEAWPRPNPIRPSTQPAGPDQPVNPQLPIIQRRNAPDGSQQFAPQNQPGNQAQGFPIIQRQGQTQQAQQGQPNQPAQPPPQPPFTLTPQEEAQLDRVLIAWEKKSQDIKTFDCKFKRWEYDPIFVKPDAKPGDATHIDIGILKYAAPDKGVFRLLETESTEGKVTTIEDARAEHWICDGKSVFQYIPRQKKLVEHRLPPDMQGKAIVDGPLPFLFGAEAAKLRQRYFIRLISPPAEVKNEIWLEAFPKFQTDAANFRKAIMALSLPDMTPTAIQMIQPNGKSHASYKFYEIVINDPLRLFQGNPFQAYLPRGWQQTLEDAPSAQAGKPAGGVR